jgi:hypothetical protein
MNHLDLAMLIAHFLLSIEKLVDGEHMVSHLQSKLAGVCFEVFEGFGEGETIDDSVLSEVVFEREMVVG